MVMDIAYNVMYTDWIGFGLKFDDSLDTNIQLLPKPTDLEFAISSLNYYT